MIDPDTFATAFAVIEERFGRPLSLPTKALYHRQLSEELTTQEFTAAMARVFRFSKFFPSVQDIIDAAVGTHEEKALAAWDTIMMRLQGGADMLTDANTLERKVMGLLGGSPMLRAVDSAYDLNQFRVGFIARYTQELKAQAMTKPSMALPSTPRTSHALEN